MRKITKIRRSIRAISPVISVLLMIAIAVVASLVAYAWVMGYIGFQTAKTGQSVQIQSVAFNEGGSVAMVYVQNVGDGAVKIIDGQCLYIDGQLDTGAAAGLTDGSLLAGKTATIGATLAKTFAAGDIVVIKVVTEGGTYSQISKVVPENGSGGSGGDPTNAAPVIDDFTPSDTTPDVTEGGSLAFSVTAYDPDVGDTLIYAWFLDGSQQASTTNAFTYSPASGASHTVRVDVSDGDKTTPQTWMVTVTSAPPALDHFDFDTITGPKTTGTPFSITIRAMDQYGAAFTTYTGTNTLTSSAGGTVNPSPTTAFTAGVWTGQVTLSAAGTDVSISTSGGGKTGQSNTFTVNAPANPLTITLRPSGSGSVTALSRSGYSGSNYQYVDDTGSGDGDSTYVYSGSGGSSFIIDTYGTEDAAVTGTINSVTVYMRVRTNNVGGTGYACTVLRSSSTNYQGQTVTMTGTTNYAVYSTTYNNNPAGGAWTWSAINALQCGVGLYRTSGGGDIRCTQVWIEVNYTPT